MRYTSDVTFIKTIPDVNVLFAKSQTFSALLAKTDYSTFHSLLMDSVITQSGECEFEGCAIFTPNELRILAGISRWIKFGKEFAFESNYAFGFSMGQNSLLCMLPRVDAVDQCTSDENSEEIGDVASPSYGTFVAGNFIVDLLMYLFDGVDEPCEFDKEKILSDEDIQDIATFVYLCEYYMPILVSNGLAKDDESNFEIPGMLALLRKERITQENLAFLEANPLN